MHGERHEMKAKIFELEAQLQGQEMAQELEVSDCM